MVATLPSPCRSSDGVPPLRICRYSVFVGRKFFARMDREPLRCTPIHSSAKLTNWLRIVASAAPAMPMSNAKISSGSSAMFSTAPETRPIME